MSPPILTLRALNRATLARQGLLAPLTAAPVARLVERAGSLQAQHPDWPPFALHSRLPVRAKPVDLAAREPRKAIVRAPLMRMTVHVVSATDYWPMSTPSPIRSASTSGGLFKRDPVTSPLGKRIAQGTRPSWRPWPSGRWRSTRSRPS